MLMIRILSILILALSISTQATATNDEVELSKTSQSFKKRKLEEKAKPENKKDTLPEVSIDLCPLFRKDVVVQLNLSHNKYLTDINFLLAYPNLISLNLRNCYNIKDNYHPVSQLTNLRTLDIYATGLTTTEPLKTLINLTSLTIFSPKNCMKYIVQLPALKDLSLESSCSDDRGDSELDQLAELKYLEKLSLCGMFNNDNDNPKYVCPSLDFLSSLIGLKTLDLSANDYLFSIEPIVNLPKLTDLNLSACKGIRDLRKISKIKSLINLNLNFIRYMNCTTIKEDLESLKELKNLRILTLDILTDAPDLPKEVIIHKEKIH